MQNMLVKEPRNVSLLHCVPISLICMILRLKVQDNNDNVQAMWRWTLYYEPDKEWTSALNLQVTEFGTKRNKVKFANTGT